MFASDAEIPDMEREIEVALDDAVILTDDYCPVEIMNYRG